MWSPPRGSNSARAHDITVSAPTRRLDGDGWCPPEESNLAVPHYQCGPVNQLGRRAWWTLTVLTRRPLPCRGSARSAELNVLGGSRGARIPDASPFRPPLCHLSYRTVEPPSRADRDRQ